MFADDTTIPLAAMYIDTADPAATFTDGRVKAGRLWLDTSTGTIGTLKKRNAGNTAWDTLINLDAAAATLTTEQVQDIVGAMFPDTATIDWTYDDATGVVNGVVIGAAPSGSAGGDLSGTYPNPAVAADAISNTELANMANATVKGRNTAGTGDPEDVTMAQLYALLKSQLPVEIGIAASDETTAITTGTAKVTFRMPFAMTVTAVRASLTTSSSSGNPTVDINEGGTTILSTKLSIDSGELTSQTAATPAVISDSALADDAEVTIDIDTAGTGAKGLKVWIIGVRA